MTPRPPPTLMEKLTALARIAPKAGVFCDYDGCLSPIVPDPTAAYPIPDAAAVLARLARRFAVVAVVSGRSAADLRARLRAPGVRLLGLYGLEEASDDGIRVAPEAEAARAVVERVTKRLIEVLAPAEGVFIERKGLSVAVHFRRAPEPDVARRRAEPIVHEEAARESAVMMIHGRHVLEVRPRAGGDKGDAAGKLIDAYRLQGALAAGDDIADLALFAGIRKAPLAFHILVESDETPPGMVDTIEHTVGSPARFIGVLNRLAELAGC